MFLDLIQKTHSIIYCSAIIRWYYTNKILFFSKKFEKLTAEELFKHSLLN